MRLRQNKRKTQSVNTHICNQCFSRVAASDLEFFRHHSVDFAKIDQKEPWRARSVYRHTMTRGLS